IRLGIVSTAAPSRLRQHGYGRAAFFVYAYPEPTGYGVGRSTVHGGGGVSSIAHGPQLDPRPCKRGSVNVRFAPKAEKRTLASACPLRAIMYGPAVRYKMDFQDRRT